MNEYEARKTLEDAAMRQALWVFLWEHHPDFKIGRPVPSPPSDDAIIDDLQRILNPKRKRFFGLF